MPGWTRSLIHVLPFESCFGFPITSLVGPISDGALVTGLLRQLLWITVGAIGVRLMWSRAMPARRT